MPAGVLLHDVVALHAGLVNSAEQRGRVHFTANGEGRTLAIQTPVKLDSSRMNHVQGAFGDGNCTPHDHPRLCVASPHGDEVAPLKRPLKSKSNRTQRDGSSAHHEEASEKSPPALWPAFKALLAVMVSTLLSCDQAAVFADSSFFFSVRVCHHCSFEMSEDISQHQYRNSSTLSQEKNVQQQMSCATLPLVLITSTALMTIWVATSGPVKRARQVQYLYSQHLLFRPHMPGSALMIGVCFLSLLGPSLAAKPRRTMLPGQILQEQKGVVPSARSGAGMVVFQGKVLVFGGLSAGGTVAATALHSPGACLCF